MLNRGRALPLVLVLALAVIVGGWWWTTAGSPAADRPWEEGSDSGIPSLRRDHLPPEAEDTLTLIRADGPYPYDQDDTVFGNIESLLPERPRGYYREYTVETPGNDFRGARRIVVGAGGEYYWTSDHYRSFSRIEDP
ncbi:MAG: ribonuclease domain-containing protein [Nocardioides sp.]